MVDAHGSLAPSLASKHLFLSRTHAQQGYKCPHNSETAFERRFQAMLRSAWYKRSWHVIVADPGAGKTMGIRDLVKTTGSSVILAVTAPKKNEDEQALGDQFFSALGLKLVGRWNTRKPKLMGHLHQCSTECLIVDDAHDLSLEHLMFRHRK
jgi:type II secretory pathway predicted ATPase ExeA